MLRSFFYLVFETLFYAFLLVDYFSFFSSRFYRDVADITDKVSAGKDGNKNKEMDTDRENDINGTVVR